ncbi:MAG: putative peptidoglycan binding domain [Cyanobacteriota bacterium]
MSGCILLLGYSFIQQPLIRKLYTHYQINNCQRLREIQRALGTINAVPYFQRRNGLRVDGVVGQSTRRALGI